MTVGDFGNGGHVVDLQKRVGEHFEVHGFGWASVRAALGGFAGHRRIERLVIGGVHFLYDDAPTFEILMEQRVGATVDVLADDDAVAWLEDRQHRVDGGQAGTERETACAMLKLRDLLLQELAGRVAAARVIPTGHGLDRFESISGRVVDRRIHGSGVVVVDRQSVDKLSVESGHGAHPPRCGFLAACRSRDRWFLLNRVLESATRRRLSTLLIQRANRHSVYL